jgi:hypothetical protein
VTQLRFDTSVATPKLLFKAMRWLTDDEYAICRKQGTSDDALKAVTMSVAQMDGVRKAGEETPLKMEGAAPGAEKEEEEQAAPVVRKEVPKTKPAPASKSSLADTVAKWDDTDD